MTIIKFSFPSCKIEFPYTCVWIFVSVQQAPTYVLAKYTSILILLNKMLLQTRPKLIKACMGTNSNDPFRIMPVFPVSKSK